MTSDRGSDSYNTYTAKPRLQALDIDFLWN